MSLVKKINPSWYPSENRSLKVGETIEITDYNSLVRNGVAVLVDENGVEQPLPGLKFPCPVCFKETTSLAEFTAHVGVNHQVGTKTPEPTAVLPHVEAATTVGGVVEEETEGKVATAAEITKARRVAALAKARAAKQAKAIL